MLIATGIYTVAEAAVILTGLCMLAMVIGSVIICAIREDSGRPLMPWSARMRVEKAKAHTETMQQHLEQEALEIKRLALDHRRTQVLSAIESGDNDLVTQLTLTRGERT